MISFPSEYYVGLDHLSISNIALHDNQPYIALPNIDIKVHIIPPEAVFCLNNFGIYKDRQYKSLDPPPPPPAMVDFGETYMLRNLGDITTLLVGFIKCQLAIINGTYL